MGDLHDSIQAAARRAIAAAIADPTIPIEARPARADAVTGTALAVAAEIAPLVRHATNAEPWYQSRVTWGAILSAVTPLLALVGWTLTPEHRDEIVAAIVALAPLVGAALTLHGRWRAKTPIGTGTLGPRQDAVGSLR